MTDDSIPLPRYAAERRTSGRAFRLPMSLDGVSRPAVAVIVLLVLMLPFLWLVQLAFRPADAFFSDELLFTPTLDAFASLLEGNFPRSIGNSLMVSTLSTGLSLLIGVPAAYVLVRWDFAVNRRAILTP